MQTARSVAGKRRCSAHRLTRAALFARRVAQSSAVHSVPSNPSSAMHTDQSASANVPRPHEAPVDSNSPDSSDLTQKGLLLALSQLRLWP